MPINPFRAPANYDVPNFPAPAGRYDPSVFANIASIGENIGQYRERSALADLARGAIDPQTGQLNVEKYAAAAALAGHDPVRALALVETARGRTTAEAAQRSLEAYHQRTASEQERANRENERLRQLQLDQPTQQVVPPSLLTPGGAYTVPRDPNQPPVYRPFPPQAVPGSQSSLDVPGPNMAAVEPGPENAPPYRVAGPPMPPPQTQAVVPPPAAAAPVPRNESFLRTLPPGGQALIKSIADYKEDPAKASREELAAVHIYRPDFDATEFQKRGSPPSGEVAGRVGLGKSFLDNAPEIKKRIQTDELNTLGTRAAAVFGQGRPAELANAISDGAESLLRGLTGAGMNLSEAADYTKRFKFSPIDTKETQLRKFNGLERALRYVITEVGKGRGGEDFLKDYRSQFGKEVLEEATPRAASEKQIDTLVGQAKAAIKRDPSTYDEALRRLQQRLPEGVDARMYLGR